MPCGGAGDAHPKPTHLSMPAKSQGMITGVTCPIQGCRLLQPDQSQGIPTPKQPKVREQAMLMVAAAIPLRKKIPKTAAAKEHPEFI